MTAKLITAILFIVCGVGIGWLAYENLMWAIWGKQNRWFEYVGFWGCHILFVAGLVSLKSLRLGSIIGCVGFGLMLCFLGPALVNIARDLMLGRLMLKASHIAELALIVGIPLITLVRLVWNLKLLRAPDRKRLRAL